MTTTSKSTKTPKKRKQVANTKPRVRQKPKYQSLRLSRRIKHPTGLPLSSWKLLKKAFRNIRSVWRPLMAVVLIYGLLNAYFVQGLSAPLDVGDLKEDVSSLLGDGASSLVTNLTVFGALATSTTQSQTEVGNIYQTLFLLVTSLVTIWLLRQAALGNRASAKQAYYNGVYALVPFSFVLLYIGLQLIPMRISSELYKLTVGAGLAVTAYEVVLWTLLCFLLALWSLYLVTSSIFALLIVTLPNTTPMVAIRSAKDLVEFRRWTILRRLFVGVALVVLLAICILALSVVFFDPIAPWLFFACVIFAPVLLTSYVFTIYRELL
jgi:hypothetical protein